MNETSNGCALMLEARSSFLSVSILGFLWIYPAMESAGWNVMAHVSQVILCAAFLLCVGSEMCDPCRYHVVFHICKCLWV